MSARRAALPARKAAEAVPGREAPAPPPGGKGAAERKTPSGRPSAAGVPSGLPDSLPPTAGEELPWAKKDCAA